MKKNVFKVIAIVLILITIVAVARELNELKYVNALERFCDAENLQLVEYFGHATETGWYADPNKETEVICYSAIDNANGHMYFGSVEYEYASSR